MNAEQVEIMSQRIFVWLDTLTQRLAARHPNAPYVTTYECEPGRKYVKVVVAENGRHRSVHAFYDPRTGDVYKAAGWKAPAKHVRFNLLDDESYQRMLDTCDPFGGYLYLR